MKDHIETFGKFEAIASLLIGVAITCPTPDFLTFLLGIVLTLVHYLCYEVTLQFIRRQSIVLSRLASVALGSIIGISTDFLSVCFPTRFLFALLMLPIRTELS